MVGVMSLSEYNRIEDMYGRKRIDMTDDQYAFILDFDIMGEIVNNSLKDGNVGLIPMMSLGNGNG